MIVLLLVLLSLCNVSLSLWSVSLRNPGHMCKMRTRFATAGSPDDKWIFYIFIFEGRYT